LDRLAAKRNDLYKWPYANKSAVCSPSRASIVTWQFVANHGITDWIGAQKEKTWRSYKRFFKTITRKN